MSNKASQVNIYSRAAIAGALVGVGASTVENWRDYKKGELAVNEMTSNVIKSAVKGAVAGGATMMVADVTAGRPVLTLATVLAAATAGLYILDSVKGKDYGNNK